MPGRQWPLSGRSYDGWVYLPLGLILAAPRCGVLDLALGSRELSRSGGPLVSTWLQPFLTLGWWPLEPQVGGKVKCLCSLPGDLGAGGQAVKIQAGRLRFRRTWQLGSGRPQAILGQVFPGPAASLCQAKYRALGLRLLARCSGDEPGKR